MHNENTKRWQQQSALSQENSFWWKKPCCSFAFWLSGWPHDAGLATKPDTGFLAISSKRRQMRLDVQARFKISKHSEMARKSIKICNRCLLCCLFDQSFGFLLQHPPSGEGMHRTCQLSFFSEKTDEEDGVQKTKVGIKPQPWTSDVVA